MKKILLFLVISTLFFACGGIKKTQEALNSGDYNKAINSSIQKLTENKTKKGNQQFIRLLEEAYKKNTEREVKHIAFMEKGGGESDYESIFKTYTSLRAIQERIKPLLPLKLIEENRDADFVFNNYEDEIIDYKEDLSEYLYDNSEHLLNTAVNKSEYKKAYADFAYLEEINPGFEDTRKKMEEALQKGIDHISVEMVNNSQQIIPVELSEDLLNFNTYGLNKKWIKYHTNHISNMQYDYSMQIFLENISISPEQVSEKQIIKEKQVVDGFTYAKDSNGYVLKDSLGSKIKIDKFITIRCDFKQTIQLKSAVVGGQIVFTDLHSKQQIDSYPLSSEFIFEHSFATMRGDKRALNNELSPLLKNKAVPFPTNEQMVYDAGEDLKARIKNIILNQGYN